MDEPLAARLQSAALMHNTIQAILLSTVSCACIFIPGLASAMPRAGSNELRLDGTYILPGTTISGLNRVSTDGYTSTRFGLGFSLGRFLTDNLEVGASVSLLYLQTSTSGGSSSSMTSPGLYPFLRLFGRAGEHLGIYGTAVAGYQAMIPDEGDSLSAWSAGGDLGAELFLADAWSLRIGPTYRYISSSGTGSASQGAEHSYGVNWGIAGYF
jgi:hypothetical protein